MGAVIGGVVSGFFSWIVAQKQIKETRHLAEEQIRAAISGAQQERTWEIASAVTLIQGEILSASTPDWLKSIDDVNRLEWDWDQAAKQLHLLGYRLELSNYLDSYFHLLRDFVENKENKIERSKLDQQRSELDQHRLQVRDRVAEIMGRLINE